MATFSALEKEAAFDRIASCFFEQNFGTVGKADLELMAFDILMQHLHKAGDPTDDYSISKTLGIPQQRVRNLKIKQQLRFGHTFDWKKELAATVVNHPHYSEDDKYIILSFNDPNIMIETQHFIEINGGFVDFSFNPKLLRMKTCDFARLMIEIGLSVNEKETWKQLRKIYREENGGDAEITKEALPSILKKGGLELGKMALETVASSLFSHFLG